MKGKNNKNTKKTLIQKNETSHKKIENRINKLNNGSPKNISSLLSENSKLKKVFDDLYYALEGFEEEVEKESIEESNPKIREIIKLLKIDPDFREKIGSIRKKHSHLANDLEHQFNLSQDVFTKEMDNFVKNTQLPGADFKNIVTEHSENIKNIFIGDLGKTTRKVLEDPDLNKDLIKLLKEKKISHTIYWIHSIKFFLFTDVFISPSVFFKEGMIGHIPGTELLSVPSNLNFDIRLVGKGDDKKMFIQIFNNTSLHDIKNNWSLIKNSQKQITKSEPIKNNFDILLSINKTTKERELLLQIFKNTRRDDIANNWKLVNQQQIKGKKFHPLKNIEIAEKILTREKKEINDYDPDADETKKIKETDCSIADELFGDDINLVNEKKFVNRIKQIRHQFKKMFNS